MPQAWEGRKYSLAESNNFDEYMKELGVGYFAREIGNAALPSIELKKDGDEYTLITNTGYHRDLRKFKSGEPFIDTDLGGCEVQSVITVDGNKLTREVRGHPPQLVVNRFGEKEMEATMKVHNVTCTRKYVAED